MSLHTFFSYLNNKRVIIVGPSPSLIGKNLGKMIDEYDIIIRIKRSFPVDNTLVNDLGKKTNILITSLKVNPVKDMNKKIYYQNNFHINTIKCMEKELDYLCFAYPITIEPFKKFYTQFKTLPIKKVKLITAEEIKPKYKQFIEELNTTPTVFLATVWLLQLSKLKELKIIGITFQKDGYLKEYKTKNMMEASKYRTLIRRKSGNNTVHNMNCEIQYFIKNIWKDRRVRVDSNLENILLIEEKKIKFINKHVPFWKPFYYGEKINKTDFDKLLSFDK